MSLSVSVVPFSPSNFWPHLATTIGCEKKKSSKSRKMSYPFGMEVFNVRLRTKLKVTGVLWAVSLSAPASGK